MDKIHHRLPCAHTMIPPPLDAIITQAQSALEININEQTYIARFDEFSPATSDTATKETQPNKNNIKIHFSRTINKPLKASVNRVAQYFSDDITAKIRVGTFNHGNDYARTRPTMLSFFKHKNKRTYVVRFNKKKLKELELMTNEALDGLNAHEVVGHVTSYEEYTQKEYTQMLSTYLFLYVQDAFSKHPSKRLQAFQQAFERPVDSIAVMSGLGKPMAAFAAYYLSTQSSMPQARKDTYTDVYLSQKEIRRLMKHAKKRKTLSADLIRTE